MEKIYLEMGKITNTHGVRGEIRAQSWGDFSDDLVDFDYFYVGSEKKKLEVEYSKPHKELVIIKFVGVDTCEKGEALKNATLYMAKDEIEELDDGNYYIVDIIGITAFLEDGTTLGIVKDIIKTGANDVFVIECEGKKEVLIPFIESCVKEVDIKNKKCVITPLEGLLE